jgi:hypothetical protein
MSWPPGSFEFVQFAPASDCFDDFNSLDIDVDYTPIPNLMVLPLTPACSASYSCVGSASSCVSSSVGVLALNSLLAVQRNAGLGVE